jgi:flagellar hook-associated protein 2
MSTSSTLPADSSSNITAQPIVSVAGSTSAAASGGSVIDVSALVSDLVAAAEAPQQALISNQTSAVTASISALGSLQSALSTFQSALTALSTPTAFNSQQASSSNQSVFTATAGDGAVTGNYSVTVSDLASAQQLLSKAIASSGSATTGTGTLNISLAGSSFSVTIDGTDNTPAGIAAAINSANGNPGVSAAVIQGTSPASPTPSA